MNYPDNPFLNIINLGPLKSVHGYSTYFRNNRFIVSALVLLGVCGCLCLFAFGISQDAQNGIPPNWSDLAVTFGFMLIPFGMCFLVIFLLLKDWLHDRHYRVGLFDGGLAIQDFDGQIVTAPWQDFKSVEFFRMKRGGFVTYRFHLSDGTYINLHYFINDQKMLYQTIIQKSGIIV